MKKQEYLEQLSAELECVSISMYPILMQEVCGCRLDERNPCTYRYSRGRQRLPHNNASRFDLSAKRRHRHRHARHTLNGSGVSRSEQVVLEH